MNERNKLKQLLNTTNFNALDVFNEYSIDQIVETINEVLENDHESISKNLQSNLLDIMSIIIASDFSNIFKKSGKSVIKDKDFSLPKSIIEKMLSYS